jgi:hypothetical protein
MIVITADCDIDDQKFSIADIAIDILFWFKSDTDVDSQVDVFTTLGNAAQKT